MSEIDWSKAPEGTTHALRLGKEPAWYRKHEAVHQWQNAAWVYVAQALEALGWSDKIVARPSTWKVEVLPPVGAVCEAYWAGDTRPQWFKFKMLYLGDEHAIADVEGDENHYTRAMLESGKVKFRPIKTPEQIAAEERDREVKEMTKLSGLIDLGWSKALCEKLYDAGYRKPKPE